MTCNKLETLSEHLLRFTVLATLPAVTAGAFAAEPVTVANYVRAESDTMIRATMKMTGIPIGSFR